MSTGIDQALKLRVPDIDWVNVTCTAICADVGVSIDELPRYADGYAWLVTRTDVRFAMFRR